MPRLELSSPDTAAANWRLQDWQADLSGPLNNLSLSARGRLESGEQRVELQTRGRAAHLAPEHWQFQLDQTTLALQNPALPGRWLLQANQGPTLDWRHGNQTDTLALSAGSLQLSGPAPGSAQVVWQPAHWSRASAPALAQADWRSEGRIEGLPLGWLELLGQTQIANLGLRGNLLFGGQWATRGGDRPQLTASLTRSSGDLQLLAEEVPFGNLSTLGNLNAGVKDASVQLRIDAEQLKLQLNWDSERAGQAQAAIESRLQSSPNGWSWPAESPLGGSLKIQLPPVGAWSLLAPPGWRLRGTLNADATLQGTRESPLWRGRFTAQDLAVRSVAVQGGFFAHALRAADRAAPLALPPPLAFAVCMTAVFGVAIALLKDVPDVAGDAAASVLGDVESAKRKRDGAPWPDADRAAFEASVRAQYDTQGGYEFASARLWDDGCIDPAATRDVLGLALGAAVAGDTWTPGATYGVFRM